MSFQEKTVAIGPFRDDVFQNVFSKFVCVRIGFNVFAFAVNFLIFIYSKLLFLLFFL